MSGSVYVCDKVWDGHEPDGAGRLTNIGEAEAVAAHLDGKPWPSVGSKVVSIDHESKFWMLRYGTAWSSARQAANWLDNMMRSAGLAYPSLERGLYGLPFVPYGEVPPAEMEALDAWVTEYQGDAVASCDVLLPSVYPVSDPDLVGGTDGLRIRMGQFEHAKRTLAVAAKIAQGRKVIAFTRPDYPANEDGTPGRLMKPIEYRFQAQAAAKNGASVCLWTVFGWMIDMSCQATFPATHPHQKLQARHRAILAARIGDREWSEANPEIARAEVRTMLLPFVQAAQSQLAGDRQR